MISYIQLWYLLMPEIVLMNLFSPSVLGKLFRPQLITALCRLSLNHLNPGMS